MATEPPATAEEPAEPPLTYKTHVLKVSIHCEGCKRKVKKVLLSIEGVYKTDIDAKLQKVTVTGNVEAETLLKKLTKSNKHAELWPEPPEQQKEKKSKKSKKKKEKQTNDPDSSIDEDTPAEPEKPPAKPETVQEPAKISGGGSVPVKGNGGGGHVVEVKVEGKKPETGSASSQSPAPEKKGSGESDDCTDQKSGGNGNGSNGKKKKKKGQKVGFEGEPSSGGAVPPPNDYTGPPPQPQVINLGPTPHHGGPPQFHLSPPRHHGNQYPPPPSQNYHFSPQQPVYAVSYNTAHPTSSYTTAYYASPQPRSFAYTYTRPETEPPAQPADFESYPRQQPLDSFELFSDENPNGCSVM